MMIDYKALMRLAPVPGGWYELSGTAAATLGGQPIQVLMVLYDTPPNLGLGAYVPSRVMLREGQQSALPPNMPRAYAKALIEQLKERARKTITMEEWLLAQPVRVL